MVLAALIFLCPLPQAADKTTEVPAQYAMASSISEKDSSLSRELPSAPQPKVKTDAEEAAANSTANSAADSTTGTAPGANAAITNSSLSPEPVVSGFQPAAVKPAATHPYEDERDRKLWYALVITSHSAAFLDAYSTRRALSNDVGSESNPLLRPFAHSGMIYAATQVSPPVLDYLGKRMM